jgi:anti-anti-sigma factor
MPDQNLEIDDKTNPAYALIHLSGSLDIFSFGEFKKKIEAWVEARMQPRLLVDMEGVTYMGSSGWSALMHLSAIMDHRQGRLVAYGASEKIKRTLKILTSDKRMLAMVDTLAEAEKAVREVPPK